MQQSVIGNPGCAPSVPEACVTKSHHMLETERGDRQNAKCVVFHPLRPDKWKTEAEVRRTGETGAPPILTLADLQPCGQSLCTYLIHAQPLIGLLGRRYRARVTEDENQEEDQGN